MEWRLLKLIINPAMIAAFILGGLMLWLNPPLLQEPWMHVKLTCVLLMAGVHGFLAKTVKTFKRDENTRHPKFYRWLNEAPTLLMVIIVIMVVVRPF
jgi:putative membrane protein